MGTENRLLFRLEQPHENGDVYVAWQTGNTASTYLATTGVNATVNIYDRYGQLQDQIRLTNLCSGFSWDCDGDTLAIISMSPQILLWDANLRKKTTVDVKLNKDKLTCLVWAKNSPILAVGSMRGNVAIYNHATSRRIPVLGKHGKKITCGSWNSQNLLALGSDDRTISISNIDGDTVRLIQLRAEPQDVDFSNMKLDERIDGENTVSAIVGKRTLFLYNLMDTENPVELSFQSHYGSIMRYKWYGDGYILIGFSAGHFVAISTHPKEVGEEIFQVKNHKMMLSDIAVCLALNKAASCGDTCVKIHDLSNLQETSSIINLKQELGLDRCVWSVDGQLMAICTKNGSVNVYVSNVPLLISVNCQKVAILTSLTEISLYDFGESKSTKLKSPITTIKLDTEPSFIGIGVNHLAVGLNNRIWCYNLTKSLIDGVTVADDLDATTAAAASFKEYTYLGSVTSVCLNAKYMSVMFDGKIQLHLIDDEAADEKRDTIFPATSSTTTTNASHTSDDISSSVITCHTLTGDFLIYATALGHVVFFDLAEWQFCGNFRHTIGVQRMFSDCTGSRLILVDVKGNVNLYNNVMDDEILTVNDVPENMKGVIWDGNMSAKNHFIIYSDVKIVNYIYTKKSIYGTNVKKINETTLMDKEIPLLLWSGEIWAIAPTSGQIKQLSLNTPKKQQSYTQFSSKGDVNETKMAHEMFHAQIAMLKFNAAWRTCEQAQDAILWRTLATEALKNLEIEFAIKVYACHLKDISFVYSLERLLEIEEYNLLLGNVAVCLGEFDLAQKWFLASTQPERALQMRRDLLHWDHALMLARKLAPQHAATLSREYAQQLEFTGNYAEGLRYYEKALNEPNNNDAHLQVCKAGIARTNLHCSNYRVGIAIALELMESSTKMVPPIATVIKECAEILEKHKQFQDAAELYIKCEQYDKAAILYIQGRNFECIAAILEHITSPRILAQYAEAREQSGDFSEAVKAYEAAKDYGSMIRLHIDNLNTPEIAIELVQETRNVEGAKHVAAFFQKLNDYASAIKYLIMSKCQGDAFELALKHGKMQLYGDILLQNLAQTDFDENEDQSNAGIRDFCNVANYFENDRNYLMAGIFWYHGREYAKSMKHLLNAAKSPQNENEALSKAIDVVVTSKNDPTLFNQLIEFLLGETNGVPRDPRYLFRLYMAQKQYREASKSAIIIADEEQLNGNYRSAHDVLYAMYQELRTNGLRVTSEMHQSLVLLHSYILVRVHVRRGEHLLGARLLLRVARNISKFQSHVVPILTSTVIECHRAGLRHAAFAHAKTLLTDTEYRKRIDAKYAKKIESVVRRPPKIDEPDASEPLTPCPNCTAPLPEMDTQCTQCKLILPFCIVTGRHVICTDITACPACDFLALKSYFIKFLETEETCPMCSEKIDVKQLRIVEDIESYFNLV